MRNYIQPGKTLAFTNSTSNAIASGDLVTVGALVGVACGDVAVGADGEFTTEGVFEFTKATPSEVIAAGDLCYNSSGDIIATGQSGSNELVGAATKASSASDTTVEVKLGVHGLTGA